jgi:hypothetical protein
MKKISAVILCCLSVPSLAQNFTQQNVTIARLGSHAGQTFYLSLKEGFSTDCAWGNLYCSNTDPNCKSYLSILLTAKSTGKPINIHYDQASAGQICTVNLVVFE